MVEVKFGKLDADALYEIARRHIRYHAKKTEKNRIFDVVLYVTAAIMTDDGITLLQDNCYDTPSLKIKAGTYYNASIEHNFIGVSEPWEEVWD